MENLKMVSGGQTGVDQGALQAAIELQIEHGGWCPKGRICEDGRIPARFRLQESHSPEYSVRTEQNVVDSDGTLILYVEQLSGGTALTRRLALKHGRPLLMIDLSLGYEFRRVHHWLKQNDIKTLNVAGPRESSEAGIAEQTRQFLHELFSA